MRKKLIGVSQAVMLLALLQFAAIGYTEESKPQTPKTGEAFLAQNAKQPGVKTTSSGLQYKVVKEGTGRKPTATDTVTVHYRGTFIDGKEFDSSYSRNQPAVFPLNGVIKGWTEGLQLMTTGSRYMLYIPPALAYGERGIADVISPNSTLIFEVELISIKP
jgi:FKBP-type peptidyl-prolyl cis-trans isomerase